jgi:hypothetical protein
MFTWNRREFFYLTASPLLAARAGTSASVKVTDAGDAIRVEAAKYVFEWTRASDALKLSDSRGRVITNGKLQPAVLVQALGGTTRRATSGKLAEARVNGTRLDVRYEGVNGWSRVALALVFEDEAFWMEQVTYESASPEDIVSLHYFAEGVGEEARPTLACTHYSIPGICESGGIGPIVQASMNLTMTPWLGHGGATQRVAPLQQWALPAHFYCGFNLPGMGAKDARKQRGSECFCCGLAELPNGDLFLDLRGALTSMVADYRSDLWGHMRGPGKFMLGARLYWAIGENYREAIRAYYTGLVGAGVVARKQNSEKKSAAVLSPQFNTWGAEVAAGREWNKYNESDLNGFYKGMKDSGMKPAMFVLDAKWEGRYGWLRHSQERFPHFLEFLDKVRSEGYRVGMWAAFLRCEDPADLGLTTSHLICGKDGKPYPFGENDITFYLLDLTQPKVQEVIRDVARKYVQTYKPDLVKFDFGYELPALSMAAPKDMRYAGERILHKGVEVVVSAMREVNPDLAVMYYSLSPLYADFFDLHCTDDLFLNQDEYNLEANRRIFFGSILGELGIPTDGSGGYDWRSMRDIWFDSAPTGTLGSLLSFTGDEEGESPDPLIVAKFNGLTNLLRSSVTFQLEAVEWAAISAARGARSPSWARWEGKNLAMVALRKGHWNGGPVSGRYRDIVSTTAAVVLASKTGDDLRRSSLLGLTPFGDGEVTWKTEASVARHADIVEHLFGGKKKQTSFKLTAGECRVSFREKDEQGTPVEWVEIRLRA